MTFQEEMTEVFGRHGISLDNGQTEEFKRYYELLIEWNGRFNLTAITEQRDVIEKHFLDSVLGSIKLIEEIKKGANANNIIRIIDIGSGAGFPALPLKIMSKEYNTEIVMVDSVNKKVTFLEECIKQLELKNIYAVHARAEDLASKPDFRERFDICIARAVARLNTLSEYCLPFCKAGGKFLAYKSKQSDDEFLEAENAIKILGGQKEEGLSFDLGNQERNIIVIKKIKNTPLKYPRGQNKPRINPL